MRDTLDRIEELLRDRRFGPFGKEGDYYAKIHVRRGRSTVQVVRGETLGKVVMQAEAMLREEDAGYVDQSDERPRLSDAACLNSSRRRRSR